MRNNIKLLILFISAALACQDSYAVFHEDWVWRYETDHFLWTLPDKNPTIYRWWMKFDGTTEIDGVIWHNFTTVKAHAVDVILLTESPYYKEGEITELTPGRTFLIREEDNRYYLRKPLEDNSVAAMPETWWYAEGDEALVYDFNLSVGDECLTFGSDGGEFSFSQDMRKVSNVSNVTIGDETLKTITVFPYFHAVDGIGWTKGGIFPYFDTDSEWWIPGTDDPNSDGIIEIWPDFDRTSTLRQIEDLEGNVIFKPWEALDGVDDIHPDYNSASDTRIFDMRGSEVKTTLPGGVYIRAGRKFIGR